MPMISKDCWRPADHAKIHDIFKSLISLLTFKPVDRLKAELEVLRKEALINSTIRNIVVNPDNLFVWKFSIYPTDMPFKFASFGIELKFPSILI